MRDDEQTVGALWAYFGKEAGSARDYEVLHNSGGAGRQQQFTEFVQSSSPGNPPPEHLTGPEALPWITVHGWTMADTQWVGVSVMEFTALRDRDSRAVAATRFFLMPYEGLRPCAPGYAALYDAVRGKELPPANNGNTIPISVPAAATDGLRLPGLPGLDHVTAALGTPGDRRPPSAAHWAAAVAAELLGGKQLLITQAAALHPGERLAVLDAITAFLPYGVRSGLSVASCVDGFRKPRARIAFGPGHTPGVRTIPLGVLPEPADATTAGYRSRLWQLLDSEQLPLVVDALRAARTAVPRTAHQEIYGSLRHLDAVRMAADLVRGGHDVPEQVDQALSTWHGGDEMTDDLTVLCRHALTREGPELAGRLRALWTGPQTGPAITRTASDVLLVASATGGDPGRAARVWARAVEHDRAAEVLTVLLDRHPAAPAAGRNPVLECLDALGPAAVGTGGPAVRHVLAQAQAFTLALLDSALPRPDRFDGWLGVLAPGDPGNPAWLRAWRALDRGTAGTAPGTGEPVDGPADALPVLRAAKRLGSAARTAGAVTVLWPALLAAARDENTASRTDPHRGHSGRLPALARDFRSYDPPAGRPGPLAELLDQLPDREVRVRTDVLRRLAGRPLRGPEPRAAAWTAYGDGLLDLHRDPHLGGDLDRVLGDMAELLLRTVEDPGSLAWIVAVLERAPLTAGSRAVRLAAEHREKVREAAEADLRERAERAEGALASTKVRLENAEWANAEVEKERGRAEAARKKADELLKDARESKAAAEKHRKKAEDAREKAEDARKDAERDRDRARQDLADREQEHERYRADRTAEDDRTGADQARDAMAQQLRDAETRAQAAEELRDAALLEARRGRENVSSGGRPARSPAEWSDGELTAAVAVLRDVVRRDLPLEDVVAAWAPLSLSAEWLLALSIVGPWWDRASDRARGYVLQALEHRIVEQRLVDGPAIARRHVQGLQQEIVTGRGISRSGVQWAGRDFLLVEKARWKALRRRYRKLRGIRWRSRFRPQHDPVRRQNAQPRQSRKSRKQHDDVVH